jgi:hypothetical protein
LSQKKKKKKKKKIVFIWNFLQKIEIFFLKEEEEIRHKIFPFFNFLIYLFQHRRQNSSHKKKRKEKKRGEKKNPPN